MRKFHFYKLLELAALKWTVSLVFIMGVIISVTEKFSEYPVTVYEYLMLIISDRLLLSIVITVPSLLLTVNLCKYRRWEIQSMMRTGNVYQWFLSMIYTIILTLIIYIIALFGVILLFGAINGFSFSTDWRDAYSFNHKMSFIDSFDRSGQPFNILIKTDVSPLLCLAISAMLLFFRCAAFCLFMAIINSISGKAILGFASAVTLNYVEVNFYYITRKHFSGIMPFENSILTSISGQRPTLLFSMIYWGCIILSLILIGLFTVDQTSEKLCLNIKHENLKNS